MGAQNTFDYKAYYNQLVGRMKASVEKEMDKAMDKTWEEYFISLDTKIHEIFNEAVTNFYADYIPKHDRRNGNPNSQAGGLYELLESKADPYGFSAEFDPGKMSGWQEGKSRADIQGFYHNEDGLYDQVFRRGWHGGAGSIRKSRISKSVRGYGPHPNPGTPYWGTKSSGRWSWGEPAEIASTPPLTEIQNKWEQFINNEAPQEFIKIRNKHLSQIKPNWWRR